MFLPDEIIPQGEISRFVESYWESSQEGEFSFLPEGTFHLIFSSNPFTLISHQEYSLGAGFYLIPINARFVSIRHKHKLVVVRAKAFTFDCIRNNAHLFAEKNLTYWKLKSGLPVIDDFFNFYSDEMHIYDYLFRLEQVVYELLTDKFTLNNELRDRVNYILGRKGVLKVEKMAKDFGITRQSLHRYFVKHIGMGPKDLGKIWRINHFMDLVNAQNSYTVSAIDAGFYDQAHLIHEFQNTFNQSPGDFFKMDIDQTLQSINRRFNHIYDPK